MNLENLKNKKVIITGGTSGLGLALARQLSELGVGVAIIARNSERLAQVAASLPGVIAIRGDVAAKEKIYSLAGEIQTRLGDPDILLNVASYLGQTPLRLLADSDCEDIELAFRTNLLVPFRLTKALLPAMLLRGSGVVVNISTDAAVNAYPGWGGYAISKAAFDHMSRIFDEELKDQGIRFIAVDPGDMNTPMHFAAIPSADPAKLRDPADSARAIIEHLAKGDFSQRRVAI